MNLREFQSWLDGFCEGKDMPPDADQWKRIRGKIRDEISSEEKAVKDAWAQSTTVTGRIY